MTKTSVPGSARSGERRIEGEVVGILVDVASGVGISVGTTSLAVAESPMISTPSPAVRINTMATSDGLLIKTLYHLLIILITCTIPP
jgi:hypothetical protein